MIYGVSLKLLTVKRIDIVCSLIAFIRTRIVFGTDFLEWITTFYFVE